MVNRILGIILIVLISQGGLSAQTDDIKPNINKNSLDSINEFLQQKYFLPVNKNKVNISLTGIIIPDIQTSKRTYTVLHVCF